MRSEPWLNFREPSKLVGGIACLAALVGVPLLIDNRLSATHSYYTELLRAHECFSRICPVDFDADGTLGRVFIDRSSSSSPQEYSLIVRENGQELMRLPYWELDGTARTHVAISQAYASGKTHLLVYEHKGREAAIVKAVYAWNGREMNQIVPSESDKELFKAMAASDVNGTLNDWLLYRMVRVPAIVGYYLVIFSALALLVARLSRL